MDKESKLKAIDDMLENLKRINGKRKIEGESSTSATTGNRVVMAKLVTDSTTGTSSMSKSIHPKSSISVPGSPNRSIPTSMSISSHSSGKLPKMKVWDSHQVQQTETGSKSTLDEHIDITDSPEPYDVSTEGYITTLNDVQLSELSIILNSGNLNDIITTIENIPVTRECLITSVLFKHKVDRNIVKKINKDRIFGWADDDFMNAYIQLCGMNTTDVKICSTHIIAKYLTMLRDNSSSIEIGKWQRKAPLYSSNGELLFKKVIFPIHVNGNHWSIVVVDILNEIAEYYDSNYNNAHNIDIYNNTNIFSDTNVLNIAMMIINDLKNYATSEEIKFEKSSFSNWTHIDYGLRRKKVTPKQINGYDCGFMVCDTIKHIIRKEKIGEKSPNPNGVHNLRFRIAYELINSKLL